jgi:hypothetical protein
MFGALHVLTARSNWVRLRFIALAVSAVGRTRSHRRPAVRRGRRPALERGVTQSYEGPEGRFGQEGGAPRRRQSLASARSGSCPHHHEGRTTLPGDVPQCRWPTASCSSGSPLSPLLGIRHAWRGAAQPLLQLFSRGQCREGLVIDLDRGAIYL